MQNRLEKASGRLSDFSERWASDRLAVLFSENKNINSDGSLCNALQFKFGNIVRKPKIKIDEALIETWKKYTVVQPGDIMINGLNLNYDFVTYRIGLVNENGIITSAYISLRPREGVNTEFYNYYFKALDSRKIFHGLGSGIRLTLSYKELKNVQLPIPSAEEQIQIVKYLNWKVSEINRLISVKKKEISILRELQQSRISEICTKGIGTDCQHKDSGIDYIGSIPSHWKVLLNGRLFKEKSRKFDGEEEVLSLSQKDGLIPYSKMQERSLHTASYDNWKLVYPNDLVLNRFKAHLGVFFASQYRGIVTFHYGVFEPKMEAISKFYEALYHTPQFRRVYAGQSNGMTVGLQNLSNQNFYDVYTVYPPIEEQKEIVKQITQVEEKTAEAIRPINAYIERLHELRDRIIFDTVTGRIDVRNIVIPDFEYYEEDLDSDLDDTEEDENVDQEE